MAADSGNAPMRTAVLVLVAIAVLYFGQEVFLPFILAVLLSFLLAPLASRLERLRTGRVGSVLITVGGAFLVICLVIWMISAQGVALANRLPSYKENLVHRIESVRGLVDGGDEPSAMTVFFNDLRRAVSGDNDNGQPPADTEQREPVPVRLVESSPLAYRIMRDWLGDLLAPFGTAAVVLVFVIFILIQRDDLRDRFIRLFGTGRVYVTTQALDEAGARVSRYLTMLMIINGSYGIAVAVGLLIIGVPSALLWGLLAALFRFVPYIGPWVASILPIALSLAASESWWMPAFTVGLFVVLELVSNNVMEPWLYGRGTGVSVIGIIFAATFWTWLWGPIGLVLAMPLTVCLTVLGRYVPQLGFFNILLSDEPALELHVRYYQRLLSFDEHEPNDIVATFLKNGSLEELYEKMLLPALSYSEHDRHAGRLTEHQLRFIHRTILSTIHDLGREFDMTSAARAVPAGAAEQEVEKNDPDQTKRRSLQIACAPAEDAADRIAGEMLVQLLTARGHSAEALEVAVDRAEVVDALQQKPWVVLVISALAPGGAGRAREGCYRLRRAFPDMHLIVGLWNSSGPMDQTRERLRAATINFVTPSLSEALEHLEQLATSDAPAPQSAPSDLARAD